MTTTKPQRRTRLTYDAIKLIAERIRMGQPATDVIATVCRVERGTVTHWMQTGRGTRPNRPALPRYVELVSAVEEAESAWVAQEVGKWTADPKAHWKLRQTAVAAKRPEYKDRPPDDGEANLVLDVIRAFSALGMREEPKAIDGEWKELGDAVQGSGEEASGRSPEQGEARETPRGNP